MKNTLLNSTIWLAPDRGRNHQHIIEKSWLAMTLTILFGLFSSPLYADRDCEDYSNGDDGWDGYGHQAEECIWFYNDTNDAIMIHRWDNYDDSEDADGGDDVKTFNPLWEADQAGRYLYLPPGRFTPVAWIDDNDWSPMWYDQAPKIEWRTFVEANNAIFKTGYIKAAIAFGQVTNYEFRLREGDSWLDSQAYKDITSNGKKYRIYGADSGINGDQYDTDRVFTIRELDEDGNEFGNLGYVPPDTSKDSNKLNVMNFNTYLLDVFKPHKIERAKATAYAKERLFENVDILVLNEIAHRSGNGNWDGVELVNDLCCDADDIFQDKTDYVDGEPTTEFPTTSGGVIILSKYKNSLSEEYQEKFNQASGADDLMPKGFMRVKFTKPGDNGSKEYVILGTHLQADAGNTEANIRVSQMTQMKKAGDAIDDNIPVIYVGDFNVEEYYSHNGEKRSEFDNMEAALNADIFFDNKTGPLRWSDEWESNFWPNGDHEGTPVTEAYDFILHSRAHPQPTANTWRYLPLLSDKSYMPTGAAEHLSDHHAVVAELDYTNREKDWADKMGALFSFTNGNPDDVSDEEYTAHKRSVLESYRTVLAPTPYFDRFGNASSALYFSGANYARAYDTASPSNYETFSYTDGTTSKQYHHAAVKFKPVGQDITIGAWVCPEEWSAATYQTVMSTNGLNAGGKNDAGYRLYLKDNGTWGAAFGDGNSRWYNNSSEHGFSDGQCHHLAATYDGDYIKLFEDGDQVSSYNIPSSSDKFDIHYDNNPLTIGANSSDPSYEPSTEFFKGAIDEVFVIGEALNESELMDAIHMAGHWKLQGGDAHDSSLQNQDGVVNGARTTYDKDQVWDKALQFNGISDYVLIENKRDGQAPYQESPYAMTIATWACNDDWSNGNNQTMISSQQSGGFRFYVTSSGYLRAHFWKDSGSYRYTTSSGLSNGQCHHLATSYSGNEIKLYIDGVLRKTEPYTSSKRIYFNSNIGLVIGAEPDSSSNPNDVVSHYQGKIYDSRIYNKVLSDSEITSLYNSTK